MNSPGPFVFDLEMGGCYLRSTNQATVDAFAKRLPNKRRLMDALTDCLCTVLGGPNAYISKYCQFEQLAKEGAEYAKLDASRLIAFALDEQPKDARNYSLFWLAAPGVTAGSRQMRVYLKPLENGHISLAEYKNHTIKIRNGKETWESVPKDAIADLDRFGDAVRRVNQAAAQRSAEELWSMLEEDPATNALACELPDTVQRKFKQAESGRQAALVLQDVWNNPADAPFLMLEYFPRLAAQRQREWNRFLRDVDRYRNSPPQSESQKLPRFIYRARVLDSEPDSHGRMNIRIHSPHEYRYRTIPARLLAERGLDFRYAQFTVSMFEDGSTRLQSLDPDEEIWASLVKTFELDEVSGGGSV